MSYVAPDEDRVWVVTGMSVAILLLVGLLLLSAIRPGERALPRGAADGPRLVRKVVPPPQAPWKITTHPSGVVAPLSKAQSRAIARQRPALAALVKRVYDGLFVHPGRLRRVLKENFTGRAARAFPRSGAAVAGPGLASTTLRRADIGIAATGGARFAVATVSVRARADEPGATAFLHRATLWLERPDRDWKVVAFSVDQDRVPDRSGERKQKKHGARNDAKRRKP